MSHASFQNGSVIPVCVYVFARYTHRSIYTHAYNLLYKYNDHGQGNFMKPCLIDIHLPSDLMQK